MITEAHKAAAKQKQNDKERIIFYLNNIKKMLNKKQNLEDLKLADTVAKMCYSCEKMIEVLDPSVKESHIDAK